MGKACLRPGILPCESAIVFGYGMCKRKSGGLQSQLRLQQFQPPDAAKLCGKITSAEESWLLENQVVTQKKCFILGKGQTLY